MSAAIFCARQIEVPVVGRGRVAPLEERRRLAPVHQHRVAPLHAFERLLHVRVRDLEQPHIRAGRRESPQFADVDARPHRHRVLVHEVEIGLIFFGP